MLNPQAENVATPIRENRQRQIDGLAAHDRLIANLHAERIEEHDRIQRLEQAALPGGDLRHDRIGDRADQIRHTSTAYISCQERLNLSHRQAPGVEPDDLVVEPREAPLVFPDELRLEGAFPITRHLDVHRAVISEHGPLADADEGVTLVKRASGGRTRLRRYVRSPEGRANAKRIDNRRSNPNRGND